MFWQLPGREKWFHKQNKTKQKKHLEEFFPLKGGRYSVLLSWKHAADKLCTNTAAVVPFKGSNRHKESDLTHSLSLSLCLCSLPFSQWFSPEWLSICPVFDDIPIDPIVPMSPLKSQLDFPFIFFVVIWSFRLFFNEKIGGLGRTQRGCLPLQAASAQSKNSEPWQSVLLVQEHFSILCDQSLFLEPLEPLSLKKYLKGEKV